MIETASAVGHAHDDNCIFCKIAAGHIPSRKVYEDEELLAFHDIAPWAPVHFLIIPKRHIASLAHTQPADAALLGRILTLAPQLAAQEGCNPYPAGAFGCRSIPGKRAGKRCTICTCT